MRAVTVCLAIAVALVARRAAADDLQLAWQAPAGCPAAKQVHDAALKTAGEAAREPLEADVRVERGERWSVVIRTKRLGVSAAERRLEATSCEALADATSVVLALALIPPEPDAPTPTPAPAPAPASAPPESDKPLAQTGDAYDHTIAAGASLATDSSTLPSPALGGRAALAWTPGRGRIELAGSYFSGQSKTTETSAAGARFTLLVAGARGCLAVVRGIIELSPCAGVDVQIVKAAGFGAAQNYDASAAWVSGAAGALVRVPVTSWLALRGEADALVPLTRPRFIVEGDGAVHRPAAVGVRGGIGAEILFL